MLLDVAPVLNIHLDSEHFNRLRPEVRVSYHLHFISSIWDIDTPTHIITLWVSAGDNKAIKSSM